MDFDPARMDAAWFVNMVSDYGGGYNADTFCSSKTFRERYPEFVAVRKERKRLGDAPSKAMIAALIEFAEAIAMEARRGETGNTGSTAEGGDSAGAKHIAHNTPPESR